MSTDEIQGGGLPRGLIVLAVAAVLVVLGIVGYLLFSSPTQRTVRPDGNVLSRDNSLDHARETLRRVNDLSACRNALQQIDAHITETPESAPPKLGDKERADLQTLLGLKAEELTEIGDTKFSLLDSHHLEACFLFRDAGEAIRLGTAGTQADGTQIVQTPLERASAAFSWMARQVRLVPGEGEPVPPQFVLRRGSGTALERALVFLSILEGLGGEEGRLHGCLIWLRSGTVKPAKLWACGVLIEGQREIHLFDPRLGLPLPGPGDAGIATLAAVRKNSALLSQLNVGNQSYDVTPAEVEAAELTVVVPVSAIAPRMRHLQDKLLPPVRVSLAQDPATEIRRWSTAAQSLGEKPPSVRVWPEGVGLLPRFLPTTEGGTDVVQAFDPRALPAYPLPEGPAVEPMSRRRLFELSLVPWTAYPRILRDPEIFPGGLGRIMRDAFGRSFIRSALEPGQSRDQMLRGDLRNAPTALVSERTQLRARGEQFQAQQADLGPRLTAWSREAIQTVGRALRPRDDAQSAAGADSGLKELWSKADAPMLVLGGALAGPRGAEVTWLLGLCLHEEAERKQSRIDLRARAGAKPSQQETADAQATWKEAAKWWYLYAEEFPTGPALAAVRRHHARAEAALGHRDAALALLENVSAPMTPLETLAYRIEARRLKEKTSK